MTNRLTKQIRFPQFRHSRNTHSATRLRGRQFRLESLEDRRLMAVDVVVFQNPINNVQFEAASLDFVPGSLLLKDVMPLYNGDVQEADMLFQARLGNFLARDGSVVTANGGLNTSYEITVTLQASVSLVSLSSTTLTVPGVGQVPESAVLKLAPTQADDDFGLQLYFDGTPDADPLSGTGFTDGQLILRAVPRDIFNSFTVFTSASDPTVARVGVFDQTANGDQFGIQTVIGIGATSVISEVTAINQAATVFLTPIDAFQFDAMGANTSNVTPFQEVNPSFRFFATGTAASPVGGVVANMGTVNRASGPDAQFQSDANASFAARRASIHGYKYNDLNFNGIDDGEPRIAGWQFYLDANGNGQLDWTDAASSPNGIWDPGEGERWDVTDANGEFWFTELAVRNSSGDYLRYQVREVAQPGWVASTVTPEQIEANYAKEFVAFEGQSMIADPALRAYAEVILDADQNGIPDLAFGNTRPGSIHGFKYKDVDANGLYDANVDQPLAGVTFELTGADGHGQSYNVLTETDANGEFWFTEVLPGTYTVSETVPEGYQSSTPTSVENILLSGGQSWVASAGQSMGHGDEFVLDQNGDRIPDLMFGNYEYGSIHGLKFKDVNANGVYENVTDTWLAGVVIELTGVDGTGAEVHQEGVTNDNGEFWFENLRPGKYSINEIVPEGYFASTHTTVQDLVVTSGLEIVGREGQAHLGQLPPLSMKRERVNGELWFGNYENGSIHGFKFNDRDGNGIYNPQVDQPLADVEFKLSGTDNVGGTIEQVVATNADGEFWFTDLRPGTYDVKEQPFGQYIPTTPDAVSNIVVHSGIEWVGLAGQAMLPSQLPPLSMRTEQILDANLDGIPDLLFGNVLNLGSIHGFKFNDFDANGKYNPDVDHPFAGIQFDLLQVTNVGEQFVSSEISNSQGEFWFEDLLPGDYIVRDIGIDPVLEVMSSTASEVRLTVGAGQELVWRTGAAMLDSNDPMDAIKTEVLVGDRLVFGNYVKGSIHGFKFNDDNRDGVYDPEVGDSPKGGVEITLAGDTNGDGIADIISVVTNDAGEFWFTGLVPGDYTVREVISHPDVQASTPTEVSVFVGSGQELVWRHGAAMLPEQTLKSETFAAQLQFGNWTYGSIHGLKFEDFNADGQYNRDDGDRSFGGFAFELIDASGQVVSNVVSDHGGHFWFTHLVPGTYTVRERTEDFWPGIMASTPTEVTVVVHSGQELVFTDGAAHLAPDAPQHEVNVGTQLMFGNYVKGSIHGFKYNDFHADGHYDPAHDQPFPLAVTFSLLQNGSVISTGLSNANGEFWFEDLIPGQYTVREELSSLPGSVHPSTSTEVTLFVGSRQELAWSKGAAHLTLGSLEEEVVVGSKLQFGNYINGAIHGVKYEDMNGDGIFNPMDGDRPWGGFDFQLVRDGNVVETAVSDHGGAFWFMDLPPGEYSIVELPASWAQVMPSTPATSTVFLGSGQELVYVDGASHGMGMDNPLTSELNIGDRLRFGNYVKGSIHGFVYSDKDEDGNYEPDDGDAPKPDVTMVLNGPNGSIETVSDQNGEFWFELLPPGQYSLTHAGFLDATTTTPVELTIRSRDELAWKKGAAHLGNFDLEIERVVGTQLMVGVTGTTRTIGVDGDFNNNGVLDKEDANALTAALANRAYDAVFDVNRDGKLNRNDLQTWVHDQAKTWFGDANLDGVFDSKDLVQIFQAAKYEKDVDAVWCEGDWNGDGRFDTSDLVAAFQDGGYEKGPRGFVA